MILVELGEKQKSTTKIYFDSTLVIVITRNPIHHRKRKHIKLKYHFIEEARKTKEK